MVTGPLPLKADLGEWPAHKLEKIRRRSKCQSPRYLRESGRNHVQASWGQNGHCQGQLGLSFFIYVMGELGPP